MTSSPTPDLPVTDHIDPVSDARRFRTALGQFATGVTIVTALGEPGAHDHAEGLMAGVTATSFNSLSFDPPLVLWSLGSRAGSLPVFEACSHYAINVLAAGQLSLAQRFASREIIGNARYEGISHVAGLGGAPLLDGCCAWFECANVRRHVEGDHVIFIGRVERCRIETHAPLLFHDGGFKGAIALPG